MDTAADMAERHAAILGELSQLGMALARELQAKALAAETPAEAEKLAAGFHRISRSVRQTIALEARLRRDLDRARREARDDDRRETAQITAKRRDQLHAAVARLVWHECEDEALAEELEDYLTAHVTEAALEDDFLSQSFDALVQQLFEAVMTSIPLERDEDGQGESQDGAHLDRRSSA